MAFEQEVFLLHKEGRLDPRLVPFFLPNGRIRENEGPMWDYKTGYRHLKAPVQNESIFLCEALKDIVGFYKNLGGYLIYAFRDEQLDLIRKLTNNDLFNSLADRYTRSYISIGCFQLKSVLDEVETNLLFLHIAKRANEHPPLAFSRNSVEDNDHKLCFRANEIFFRHGSSTLPINNRHDLLVFAFGERRADIGDIPSTLIEIDNNLPSRDPNLIEFVGRREYLISLWNWLVDPRNPVKILTALGGTGKTAIAYEFCEQIVKSRSQTFEKVIWLTAKSQTYAAILQKYVSTTRTDFTNVTSFLDALLREIGCLESDFQDFDNVEEKIDFAKEVIKDIPVLVVVDDLDSLDNDQQIDLYSRIAQLFDQASSGNVRSRVLFTSRLEPNAGINRLMKVGGFSKEELGDYVATIVRHLDGNTSWGQSVKDSLDLLHEASKGSPIFIASILRLVSFGEPLKVVIDHWRGQDGEVVRRFAFEREIASLEYSDWRALYVLQLLSSSSFEELKELLSEDRVRLQASLLRLSQFHMFSGGSNPSTGSQISVPEPIRLMVRITEEKLRSDDAGELRTRCARINKQVDGQSALSRALRGVALLWRRSLFDQALIEAKIAVSDFPRSGDASFFLGRSYLALATPDFEAANNAFTDALQKKCERLDLYEYWALSKLKMNDLSGLLRLTLQTPEGSVRSGITLLYRFAGMYRIARQREDRLDLDGAIQAYTNLQKEISEALRNSTADPVSADIRRLGNEVGSYRAEIAAAMYSRQVAERVFGMIVESYEDGLTPTRWLKKIVSDLAAHTTTLATNYKINGNLRIRFERHRRQLRFIRLKVAKIAAPHSPMIIELDRADQLYGQILSGAFIAATGQVST